MIYQDWPWNVPFRSERDPWNAQPYREPLETEMQGGNVRNRRRPGDDVATMQWGRALSPLQLIAYRAFLTDIGDGTQRFWMPVSLDGQTYELRLVQIAGGVGAYRSVGRDTAVSLTVLVFPASVTPAVPVITAMKPKIAGTATSGAVVQVEIDGVISTAISVGAAWTLDVPSLADGVHSVRARQTISGLAGPWSMQSLLYIPQ